MEEIWADIEGYENLYAISSKGRCWSYKTNKLLKEIINNDGYLRFSLFKDGKQKRYLVHRLVAKSFVDNPNQYPEINHINENVKDNCVENLEWCSYKYNCNFGTRNERAGKAISKSMTNNKKISKAVCAYKDGELVMTFQSTQEAQRQGFNQGAVCSCCRNCYIREGNNVYKGFTWKYI